MSDVYLCAHCGRPDQLLGMPHSHYCLACGNSTNLLGRKLPVEPQFEDHFMPPVPKVD